MWKGERSLSRIFSESYFFSSINTRIIGRKDFPHFELQKRPFYSISSGRATGYCAVKGVQLTRPAGENERGQNGLSTEHSWKEFQRSERKINAKIQCTRRLYYIFALKRRQLIIFMVQCCCNNDPFFSWMLEVWLERILDAYVTLNSLLKRTMFACVQLEFSFKCRNPAKMHRQMRMHAVISTVYAVVFQMSVCLAVYLFAFVVYGMIKCCAICASNWANCGTNRARSSYN